MSAVSITALLGRRDETTDGLCFMLSVGREVKTEIPDDTERAMRF